jgi:diguanylate cyclase (GGDEF)-like protein
MGALYTNHYADPTDTVSRRAPDLADAVELASLIAGMTARPPGETTQLLAVAVEEIVRMLGGQAGIGLLPASGLRIRGATNPRWCGEELNAELCRGLLPALKGDELVEIATEKERTTVEGTPVSLELLLGPGRLTVVPLSAGSGLEGWVLVRNSDPQPADRITRTTVRLAGRIAGALIGQDRLGRAASDPFDLDQPTGGRAVGHRHRIVVVEDDLDVAGGLQAALEEEGYEVELAGTADQALITLRRSPPSLVILDVSLPDGDGFGIARTLAAHRRTAHLPVLFLSGAEDLATRVRTLHREEADFLHKPFGWKELITRVEQAILRAQHRDELLSSARTDELTGLGNRRLFEEGLATEAARIDRYGTAFSIAVLDVDRLKTINDQHGHAAGSAVLRAVGDALRHTVRETDLAARYGGDEFVVLLPHTDLQHATAFGERVLTVLRTLHPCGLAVSVSIGVAAFDENRDASVQDLFERADQTAYRAKRDGGNRVYVDPAAA